METPMNNLESKLCWKFTHYHPGEKFVKARKYVLVYNDMRLK